MSVASAATVPASNSRTDIAGGADADAAASIVIRTPGLAAAEIAAVTAVLTAIASGPVQPEPTAATPDAWSRSQRAIRTPIVPGPGRWRSFEG